MPKRLIPTILPYSDFCYDDDQGAPGELDLSHLSDSFELAKLLAQMGHEDAAELARPVHRIAGFKAAALIEQLHKHAADCAGVACIVVMNSERSPEFLWSFRAANGVNELNRLKEAGGHVLGFLCFPAAGGVVSYPVPEGSEPLSEELRVQLLNVYARSFEKQPQYLAAAEFESVQSLDEYTDWAAKYDRGFLHDDDFEFPSGTEAGQV